MTRRTGSADRRIDLYQPEAQARAKRRRSHDAPSSLLARRAGERFARLQACKRLAFPVVCAAFASLLAAAARADDRVVNSKHDLSRMGPGPVRAVEEGQVCIFCHAPHNANPDSVSAGGTEANGPHGSRYDHLLVAPYQTADFTTESQQAYALCYRCHDRTSILNNESFSRHREHVVRNRTPCSACHAPHGVSGSSANHGHLINFDLSIVSGERFYIDSGRFSGSCTLTCHGVRHVNLAYSP